MKTIFVPFRNYENRVGGPATFMNHFKRFLDERDFEYAESLENIKAAFFPVAPVSYSIDLLKSFKKKGVKIIQRLDGVYYPSKHGDEYIFLNKDMKEIHNDLADIVIYQSKYSKLQCESMLGKLGTSEFHIINNGTDKKIFYPCREEKKCPPNSKFVFLMTGVFRHPEMIEPVVKALDLLQAKVDFKLITIGPITNEKIKHYFERPYIHIKDNMHEVDLAEELRKSDLFIYSILNPSCPNSVIEAISCGIPVIGFKTGAMEELLYFNKELLAEVSDDIFQEYKNFDEHKLAEKILLSVEEYTYFKQRALEYSYLYSFEETGGKYLDIFKDVESSVLESGLK